MSDRAITAGTESTARRQGRLAIAALAALGLLCAAPVAGTGAAPSAGQAAKGKSKAKKVVPFLRASEAVVRTGAELPRLLGAQPGELQAYRFKPTRRDGRWIQVPVQVDERALVDFGRNPANGSVPLSGDRTVYGTPPLGQAALQYTDPGTFVGADPNPTLDGDDEVVFMASDTGARAPKRAGHPRHAKAKGAVRLALRDPLNGAKRWIYLFRDETKKKKVGKSKGPPDYVSYSFRVLSGEYRAAYDRRDGPNPEASAVSTPFYRAGFSDRWYFDQLRINAGGATGAEILDGYKFGFATGGCGRSEATFNAAEGAFVANVDGPVRAIRSYVGANSGPYTQRTHLFYRQRHEIVTDLRVHPVPGPFTHYDLSPAAAGMAYLDQLHQVGAPVDGVPDGLGGGPPPAWHLWRGAQGSFFVADRATSSIQQQLDGSSTHFHEDNSTAPSFTQCWGDADLFGAAGIRVATNIPDTDVGSSDFLRGRSVNVYAPPGAAASDADLWSRQLDAPLKVGVTRFRG